MSNWKRIQPKLWLVNPLLAIALLAVIACGTAAPAEPEPVGDPEVAPVVEATPIPTATPEAVAEPPEIKVHPGKVTLMLSSFSTERFDSTYGSVGKDYHKAFHGFLVSWDNNDGRMVISPGIATNWEISSDTRTWTFTIRKGVKFHDGKALTAEDVLWTLQHAIGPQALEYAKGGTAIGLSKIMDRIEQTRPDQVSVTTKVPFPEFPINISENENSAGAGVVLPRRATLNDENEAAAYERNPIGAGMIKLVKRVPADSMTFERFADYYYQPENGFPTDKRLNFSLLDLRLVPEEATRAAALRAGEVDIARVSPETRGQVEAGGGRVVFGTQAVAFWIFQRGCWKPQFPCSDKRVRQALNYAIDKELMRDKLYGGPEVMQVKGWGIVSPSTIGYSPELDPYPYDPNKARQLLADAGYPGGKDFGKLIVNTHEDPLIPFLPESAQLAAELWRRELGLDVEVRVGDKVALAQIRTLTPEDWDGQIYWSANNPGLEGAGNVRRYYLEPVKEGPATWLHNDPDLFALVEQTLVVSDSVEREKVFNSTYRRLRDEAYEISIGSINAPWGVGPRIVKYEPYPLAEYASALHTITLK